MFLFNWSVMFKIGHLRIDGVEHRANHHLFNSAKVQHQKKQIMTDY